MDQSKQQGTDLSNQTEDTRSAEPRNYSMDEKLLLRLRQIILDNLQNEDFTVEFLADEVAFSRSHLYRRIHALTGQSISTFIRNVRLEKAHELLRADVATVSEIGFQVGFGSNTYFSKCFHDAYGYPPGEVKNSGMNNGTELNIKPAATVQTDQNIGLVEALHPKASTSVIEEVFQALAKQKASLEKYLVVDEEEGESVDIRILAYQIIRNYPWPIGIEIRRLFTISLRNPDKNRLDQIQRTIRRCLRLLTYLMCIEAIDQREQKNLELHPNTQKTLKQKLDHIKDGDLLTLIEQLSGELLSVKDNLFVPELGGIFDGSFKRELQSWLDPKGENNEAFDTAERCLMAEQSLIMVLKKLAFLSRYKLVNVSSIEVRKPKFNEASYKHSYHFLNSTDAEFKRHIEDLRNFSDSNAVLLMSSIKETGKFLNLQPFIIDTYSDNRDASSLIPGKRDIYLLNRCENGQLFYEGSEVTVNEDMTRFSAYEDWLGAYQKSKEILCGS